MNWLVKLRDRLFGVNKLHFLMKDMNKSSEEYILFQKRELKAFEILKPYFPDGYLFETGFSMSFQTIQHILNDIYLYKPKVILEFGSGLSTQIIANFLNSQSLKTKFYSIDDDQTWQASLQISCPLVFLLNFPLVNNSVHSWNREGKWYEIPDDHQLMKELYDLVIVDAPKGSLCKNSRYGFVPFLLDRLSENAIVYVDDSQRQDEAEIVQCARKQLPNLLNIRNNYRYSRLSGDQIFYTRPS